MPQPRLWHRVFLRINTSPQNFNSPRTYLPRKKKLQSTKSVKSEVEVEYDSNFYLDTESVNNYELCATIITFNIKRSGFSDIAGSFPYQSSRGDLHVMVMYDYDRNSILAEPIKNRQASTIRHAFLKTHKVLKDRGIEQKNYMMDNEYSSHFKEAMKKYEINFQLAPPHMHRNNSAE